MLQFLAALDILHQDDLKNRLNLHKDELKNRGANQPIPQLVLAKIATVARQGIEAILSPKKQRRPLPSLLYKSFFFVHCAVFYNVIYGLLACIMYLIESGRFSQSPAFFKRAGL